MKIVIDIAEGMLDELRTCKFPIQDAYRLCAVIENGTPLPEGAEILTKEAYSDLCLRASHERNTGKWVKHDTGHSIYYDCSLCSGLAKCTETADAFIWKLSKYCPECGAKMEGAE